MGIKVQQVLASVGTQYSTIFPTGSALFLGADLSTGREYQEPEEHYYGTTDQPVMSFT
jgi:hypothetical protein